MKYRAPRGGDSSDHPTTRSYGELRDGKRSRREASSGTVLPPPRAPIDEIDVRYELELREQLLRQRATRDARRHLEKEDQAGLPLGAPLLLSQLEATPVRYRVDQILPYDSKTTIIASAKTGKTTFVLSLIAALTTGQPFLGEFEVEKISGKVGYLNFEMADSKFRSDAQSIGVDLDSVVVFQGRNYVNPFQHSEQRQRIVDVFLAEGVELVVIDPLSNAFPFTNQDNNSEVRAFLSAAWDLVRDCKASDLLLIAHAGKDAGKGPRGASAISDDADVLITLTKAHNGKQRKVYVDGRYGKMDGLVLAFDPTTQQLLATPPAVSSEAIDYLPDLSDKELIYRAVEDNPGATRKELRGLVELTDRRFNDAMRETKRECDADPSSLRS